MGCRTKVFPGDGGRRAADSWGWRAHEHPFPLREVWGGGWLDLAPVLPASFEAEAAVSFQVDFIWINRDQKHFEWFVSLLTKLEMEQAEQEPGGEWEAEAGQHSPLTRGSPALCLASPPGEPSPTQGGTEWAWTPRLQLGSP